MASRGRNATSIEMLHSFGHVVRLLLNSMTHLARVECLEEGILVDDTPASAVDNNDSILHLVSQQSKDRAYDTEYFHTTG